ncbi:glycine/D-amino acid oxidase-like deaminating enzyme [Nocardia transvalensis]|uniref:Glycine/D-amino acid oxidase-like deaminating enzyme n=1 Tax=Nocardia transvalensis TaxID=37333 RepID=A0A7W9PJG1_9NOCA|nr:DUF4873 domain-containing protein [Nocardia transvalensis]MBB5917065.1 glycine/D-amino acid oxidase-like deaminating enzyme [Nocardia transvalensis]
MSGDPAIVVVGAGTGGIAAANELRSAGIEDFVVLEKGVEARDAAARKSRPWPFGRRPGFRDPLRRTTDRHESTSHVRPRSEVTDLDFDDEADRWEVRTTDGRLRPRVVVLTSGALRDVPRIAGVGRRTIQDVRGEAFLGVALHGFPNLFLITGGGQGISVVSAQARYIRQCVERMRSTASTRIEVRAATQHEFTRRVRAGAAPSRRALRRPGPHHFDLTVPAEREPAHEYSGPALLDAPGAEMPVTVALTGHPDPIDGRYHWYGRVSAANGDDLPDPRRGQVHLTLPGGTPAAGTLQERDPWGNLRIVGLGTPPFPTAAAETY